MVTFDLKIEDIAPKKSGKKWRFDCKEGRFEVTVWGDSESDCRQNVIDFFELAPKATVRRTEYDGIWNIVTLEDGYKQAFFWDWSDETLIAECRKMKEKGIASRLSDY